MARLILTHVGSSLLRCAALSATDFELELVRDDLEKGDRERLDKVNACVKALETGLRGTWNPAYKPHIWREDSPAEIATLSLLRVQPHDRVVLLHSDTASGRFCAAVLKEALHFSTISQKTSYPRYAEGSVDIAPVAGLIVTEGSVSATPGTEAAKNLYGTADTFIRKGLTNYIARVWDEYQWLLSAEEPHSIIFNITGGYKGMIPVARDLAGLLAAHARVTGRQLKIEHCYLYEDSNELIHYDVLPVLLDWGAIPVQQLNLAGHGNGVEVLDMPVAYLPLFEANELLAHHWHRSPLGEVVWALCQPGRIDYRRISAPERKRLQELYALQNYLFKATKEEIEALVEFLASNIEPVARVRKERELRQTLTKLAAMEPELLRFERLLGLDEA